MRTLPSYLKHDNGSSEDYRGAESPLLKVLRFVSAIVPGEYLKTAIYLNCIDRPRRSLRDALSAFYRFDHVYAVLREVTESYRGNFSVLEFGTSDGYSFVKLLYATRYLGLSDRVIVHTFDSFEGMPETADERDREWVSGDDWVPGEFKGDYRELEAYCRTRYSNFCIHRGYFDQTLDPPFLESLTDSPPILIWIDCDYYSSSMTVFERLIDRIPNGCVVYFDDLDNLNYGSRMTGEARLVHEINSGKLGEGIELVPDPKLSLYSRRIYRFFRLPPNRLLEPAHRSHTAAQVRHRHDGSPLP
jgi:hypothetical protein